LASRHPELDRFLVGGLPFGSIVELGSPLGQGGRRPLIEFVAAATQGHSTPMPCWVLWVYGSGQVYPPAWRAHGVDLQRICFARSYKPLADLRPALLSPLFKMIVLDAPTQLSADDLTFLAHHVRLQNKLLVLIRNHLLQQDGHSVWPRLRLNCWRQREAPPPSTASSATIRGDTRGSTTNGMLTGINNGITTGITSGLAGRYHLEVIRGLSPRSTVIQMDTP
jgi:hypothetical protein